ncbi:unnamed protein product [Bursaphelenchus xylophilus]|uniref:(pine wood nematode) hypothetical protein n=1 Tax=Bursaphelenchus xylophilus TaxID=6326 RepID=A0A1I7RI56_BURXY|nr:unnamed protein product [Bursaphelenchus xylophilus]CAG9115143.1 unnamed protein product [Bursaphelenchus xylophilus]
MFTLPGRSKEKQNIISPHSLLEFIKDYPQAVNASVEFVRRPWHGKGGERIRDTIGYVCGYLEGKKFGQGKLKFIELRIKPLEFSIIAFRNSIEIVISWSIYAFRIHRTVNDYFMRSKIRLLHDLAKYFQDNFTGELGLSVSVDTPRTDLMPFMEFIDRIKSNLNWAKVPHPMLQYLEECEFESLEVSISCSLPYLESLFHIAVSTVTLDNLRFKFTVLQDYPPNPSIKTLNLIDGSFFLLAGQFESLIENLPKRMPNLTTVTITVDPFRKDSLKGWLKEIPKLKRQATRFKYNLNIIHKIPYSDWNPLVQHMMAVTTPKPNGKITSERCEWTLEPVIFTAQRSLPPESIIRVEM